MKIKRNKEKYLYFNIIGQLFLNNIKFYNIFILQGFRFI